MATHEIDGGKLMQSITLSIRFPKGTWLRMWVATRLFALTGWVAVVDIEAEIILPDRRP